MTTEWQCSKCGEIKNESEFYWKVGLEAGKRPVSSWCKECLSKRYFDKTYNDKCSSCKIGKKVTITGMCNICNEEAGIRACPKCQQVKLVEFKEFYGKRRVCRLCYNIKRKNLKEFRILKNFK